MHSTLKEVLVSAAVVAVAVYYRRIRCSRSWLAVALHPRPLF